MELMFTSAPSPGDVPTDIADLLASFLPTHGACQLRSGLLNQQGSSYCRTPLLCAVWAKSLAQIQLLVDAGADPNVRTKHDSALDRVHGVTALDLARHYGQK